jgi:RNA polymerase sigma-70 factor, ECF subfamily
LAGHSEAFGQLVEKYQDRLFNSVFHVIGNREDARDVVQEAFVQAFLKLEAFRGASAFYTWLYRIAFNTAATCRRHWHAVRAAEMAGAARERPGDDGQGPLERMEQSERCRQVRAAIARLGDEHRGVLVLREIEGCSYEQIAEILEVPIGTVRSRLSRAREQLREELRGVLIAEPSE